MCSQLRTAAAVPGTGSRGSRRTKSAPILARRGQGLFKQRVRQVEVRCRITGVDRIEHLQASHCKPWRDSSDSERLDGENGLLCSRLRQILAVIACDSPANAGRSR
jgi:hypothetical protein